MSEHSTTCLYANGQSAEPDRAVCPACAEMPASVPADPPSPLTALMEAHTPRVDGYCDSGIYIGCSCGWSADYGIEGWCPDFRAALSPAPAGQCSRIDMQGDERCGLSSGHDGPDLFPDHFCRIVAEKVHLIAPAPAGLDDYEAVRGALITVAQWDSWASDWLAKHPRRAATRPAEDAGERP